MSEILAELMTAEALAAFATLAALEIVLGIDNLMFVQIVASRCKPEHQDSARRWGLALALLTRLGLLFSISWVAGLVTPIATIWSYELSWRDIILLAAASSCWSRRPWKSTTRSKAKARAARDALISPLSRSHPDRASSTSSSRSIRSSPPSAWRKHLSIMITAVVVSMIVMLVAAGPLAAFVSNHPDREDAGAVVPAADRHGADRRRPRTSTSPRATSTSPWRSRSGVEALNLMARRKSAHKVDSGERVI